MGITWCGFWRLRCRTTFWGIVVFFHTFVLFHRVTIQKDDGRRSFLLCFPLFYFVSLYLDGGINLPITEILQQLCYLLDVAIGQGLVVLRKVLLDRGNAFFVKFVEALTIFLPVLLVGLVRVELCGLLCPFGPSSVQRHLKLFCESCALCF